jgi:hypothetical protein
VAVASSIAASRFHTLLGEGHSPAAALTGGFGLALWVCGPTGLAAVPVVFGLIRRRRQARRALHMPISEYDFRHGPLRDDV